MMLPHLNSSLFISSFSIRAIVFLMCLRSTIYVAAGGNETDRQALLEFKAKITHDPSGILSSWNDSIHFCQWYGISCGRRHQRVTVLDLPSLKLEGSISAHIGNLSFLTKLNLQNNTFVHEIPQELGHLRRLTHLDLMHNSIGGKIPTNISSWSNLLVLNLAFNPLEGEIPLEIGALVKLQFFAIEQSNLTGTIPQSVGNLSSLQILYLPYNNLVGSIPDSIGQLTKLIGFNFVSNSLSGTIPPSIYNLSSIKAFDFGDNFLQGNLPPDLFVSLPSLTFFSVGGNGLTGSIPVSVSNASKIVYLQLLKNKFTGKLPSLRNLQQLQVVNIADNQLGSGEANDDMIFLSSLSNISLLEQVEIGGNNFGFAFPEQITNFSIQLQILGLSDNQIYGSIPSKIDNLVNLQAFAAESNQLSGIIPPNIGNLQNLKVLYLGDNRFSGYVPHSIGNLTKIIELVLRGNILQGSIPSILGECQNLLLLDLARNNLSGAIPPQVIGLSSLSKTLDLSRNRLSGVLPLEIGNLKGLGFLDLSQNTLSGEIPSTLGSCVSLEDLNMSGNFLQGPIPSSLGSSRALQFLGLSSNNFSGEIPEFLSQFAMLQYLNLSYNNFEGMVPAVGVFKNASAISINGNSNLCGGIPELKFPACSSKRPNKKSKSAPTLVLSVVFGILGLVALVLSVLFLFWMKRKRKQPDSLNYPLRELLELSYGSLFKATDGFSSANMIGAGSFGSVYKGKPDEGGQPVAIKVLNLMHHGASKSFKAECEAWRNIRHRNLVKVLTACSSIDYNGNDFKALVYEFMANRSLEDWLHPATETTEGADVTPRNLNLLQRLNIAIDVACALVYLHQLGDIPVVHCDLKPSNILLDEEMTGRVGDFGLAKFLHDQAQSSSIGLSSSIRVRGTVGYAPPEYGIGNEVSTSGDVYSYGIILLELFTGKRPTDEMFNGSSTLHNFVKEAFPNQVVQIVDPVLFEGEAGEASSSNAHNSRSTIKNQRTLECLISILGIGVACSVEVPIERMNINAAANQLVSVRDKFLGKRIRSERPIAVASNRQVQNVI